MAIVGWAKYTRTREISRGRDAMGAPKIFGAPFASRLLEISPARMCISPAPQSPSPKLETTRSLCMLQFTLRLKQQRKQGQVPRCGQDKKHTGGSSINYGQETEIKKNNRHLPNKLFFKKVKNAKRFRSSSSSSLW